MIIFVFVFSLQVVDLLLTMTKAASKHSRRNIIFDPYPTVVDPCDPNELALNPKVSYS